MKYEPTTTKIGKSKHNNQNKLHNSENLNICFNSFNNIHYHHSLLQSDPKPQNRKIETTAINTNFTTQKSQIFASIR